MCFRCKARDLMMPELMSRAVPYVVYIWHRQTEPDHVLYVGSGNRHRPMQSHGQYGVCEIVAATGNRMLATIFEALVFEKTKPEDNHNRPAKRGRHRWEWQVAEEFWNAHYANRWPNDEEKTVTDVTV